MNRLDPVEQQLQPGAEIGHGLVTVDMAGPLREHRGDLETAGWEVRLLEGLDHLGAMQAATVLFVIRPWLSSTLRL